MSGATRAPPRDVLSDLVILFALSRERFHNVTATRKYEPVMVEDVEVRIVMRSDWSNVSRWSILGAMSGAAQMVEPITMRVTAIIARRLLRLSVCGHNSATHRSVATNASRNIENPMAMVKMYTKHRCMTIQGLTIAAPANPIHTTASAQASENVYTLVDVVRRDA